MSIAIIPYFLLSLLILCFVLWIFIYFVCTYFIYALFFFLACIHTLFCHSIFFSLCNNCGNISLIKVKIMWCDTINYNFRVYTVSVIVIFNLPTFIWLALIIRCILNFFPFNASYTEIWLQTNVSFVLNLTPTVTVILNLIVWYIVS